MDKPARTALLAPLFAVSAAIAVSSVHAQEAQTVEVKSRLIENFRIGSDEKNFGSLEFAGGLEMIGSSRDFGGWSGISLKADQKSFIGIADTGFWITGTINRDANGVPQSITASMREINGSDGKPITAKWQADAEGIALKDDTALVSFERAHRIAQYALSDDPSPQLMDEFTPPVPLYELRDNRGFEGIAIAPKNSVLAGALVGVSEKSLDANKNIMAFAKPVSGKPFEFSVKRRGAFDVTDVAFLPDGDFIVLERRFNLTDGIAMRLRRIVGTDIKSGATVDGSILMTADMAYQIDNIEGMDITADKDGVPRITLVSDDNHSLLQRNLLLEFRLVKPQS